MLWRLAPDLISWSACTPRFEGGDIAQYGQFCRDPEVIRSPLQKGEGTLPHEANDALVAAPTSLPKSTGRESKNVDPIEGGCGDLWFHACRNNHNVIVETAFLHGNYSP